MVLLPGSYRVLCYTYSAMLYEEDRSEDEKEDTLGLIELVATTVLVCCYEISYEMPTLATAMIKF